MIIKKFILILVIFTTFKTESKSILLIDTYCNNIYSYNNFLKMLINSGFEPEVLNFYQIKKENIDKFDAVFLLISPDFLNCKINKIVKDVILKLQLYSCLPDKLIGLIFPNNTISELQLYSAKNFIKKLELLNIRDRFKLKSIINNFLLINLHKNKPFSTAIESIVKQNKDKENKLENIFENFSKHELDMVCQLLPRKDIYQEKLKNYFPLGLYINNKTKRNHIFFSKIPMLLFAEINENFRVNPIDKDIRNNILSAIQQALNELFLVVNNGEKFKENLDKKENLNKHFIQENRKKYLNNKLYNWIENGIICGWVDLDAYDDEFLEKGINNIFDAKINLLWIRFLPELYLSNNAIFKDKKEIYFEKIKKFTHKLKNKFEKENKIPPKIFVGVELTGNFKNIFPKENMKDLYARIYTKIPSPLDYENFWQIEFIDVLEKFVDIWEKSIGNGLKIDGIFFDFEMYHAPDQESSFPALSDFSNHSFNIYLNRSGKKIELQDLVNRINYLYKNNLLTEYFSILQNEAFELGKKLRCFIKTKIPNAIIGTYMAVLPNDWFYLGLLSGLSTKEEPIILATFNNDYYSHYNWFLSNQIFAFHISAILLSKFKDEKSLELIKYLKNDHDGIWLNRFSRLGKAYEDEKWWSNESTSFDHEKIIKFLGSLN